MNYCFPNFSFCSDVFKTIVYINRWIFIQPWNKMKEIMFLTIQCIRNILFESGIQYTWNRQNKIAGWKFSWKLYELHDNDEDYKLCNKPTVFPKMKVQMPKSCNFNLIIRLIFLYFTYKILNTLTISWLLWYIIIFLVGKYHMLPEAFDTAEFLLL